MFYNTFAKDDLSLHLSNMQVGSAKAQPMCGLLQALAGEGCALMWGLVELSPTVLASFVNCNLETAAPRQILNSDLWTSILVSLASQPYTDLSCIAQSNSEEVNILLDAAARHI